nr:Os02g0716950 [Ipomoea trifida]
MAVVKVAGDPSGHGIGGGDFHDDADEQAADGAAEALEPVGGLGVEEFELADVHEDLGGADQHVLRDLPEDAERAGGVAGAVLDGAGGDHGHDGDDEADPHPLELRQAAGAGLLEGGDEGVEEAAVDEDEGGDAEDVEAGHAGRRDVEAGDVGFHGGALLHEQGGHLGEDDGVEYGA